MVWIHSARRICEWFGWHALTWKLRELDLAIEKSGLVLDVGPVPLFSRCLESEVAVPCWHASVCDSSGYSPR